MEIKPEGIIGQSTTLREVFRILGKVAPTESTVLVTGESGTGKELLVRALHDNSLRHDKPFVPINCGAIPKDLLESELFGHEKGAFTHAVKTRPGRFEVADGGTIFLDEIGEMDLTLQVKILRVLQEKEIERVGGTGAKKVDVRIVAATNRDLELEVSVGRFREDLYYRLNVIPLHLPPLRERGGDILLLVDYFLKKFCKKRNRTPLALSPGAARCLAAYTWPGNVRELENFMERVSILCDGPFVDVTDLPRKILDGVGNIADLPEPAMGGAPATASAESAAWAASAEAGAVFLAEAASAEAGAVFLAEAASAEAGAAFLAEAASAEAGAGSFVGAAPFAGSAPQGLTPASFLTGSLAGPVEGGPRFGFVWPTLRDLEHKGMDLKSFLDAVEERLLTEALERAEGIKNQAAEILGIKRTTLIEKLKKRNVE